jgi:L-ascorbate metabolism protein UlaG (beta-lactamase superfamily)
MKKSGMLLFVLTAFMHGRALAEDDKVMTMADQIDWIQQAAVRIDAGSKTIYIDPYQIQKPDVADLVLVTHSHQDHLSPDDIAKVITDRTLIVAPLDCADQLEERFKRQIITLEPGMQALAGGVLVKAVPAYNINKTQFHPREKKWVGYVLTIDGVSIYHAGDTERIPEMQDFTCDIALLPLGQTYTMDSVEDAVQAALDVKAKIAIPIHYGLYEGKDEDAVTFQEMLEGKCKVIIKPRGQS